MEKATAVPSANARVVHIEIRQAAVVRKFLGMFENVANTTDGMNQWSWSIVIHFTAQPINMNIHNVCCGINPHLPDVIQNHGSRYHATFIPAQVFQQRKFLGG
jgi:hypothetical protein